MEMSPSRLLSWACCLLLLCLSLPAEAQPCPRPAHVDSALAYVGTTEPNGENKGPAVVRRSLNSVGLGPGYAYCAAFVSYLLDQTEAQRPTVRSALASDFLEADRAVDAADVRRGSRTLKSGAVVVWRKGNGPYGHAGIVWKDDLDPSIGWENRCAHTVEANTTPPDGEGSQREGQGIWTRHRCIVPTSYFRIEGFVPTAP